MILADVTAPASLSLLDNAVLAWGLAACGLAQFSKLFIELLLHRRWRPAVLIETGGMPSSHSALVTGTAAGVGWQLGFADPVFALAATMIADGNTPFCIGIESGTATGWAFTDWVEDMMLRRHSGETYDAWTSGELDFASDEVSGVMQEVLDVWNTPGMVYAQGGTIASTSFRDNGEPLVNGDCMMHRQASFFSSFFPDNTPVQDGSEGAIDVFQFPVGDIDPPIVLTAGTLVGAFNDRPEVMAIMEAAGKEAARRRPRLKLSFELAIEFFRAGLRLAATGIESSDRVLAGAVASWLAAGGTAAQADRHLHHTLEAIEAVDRNANLGMLVDAWTAVIEQPRQGLLSS